MAVAFVQEFAIGDRSTETYDWLSSRLLDIWESREQAERFVREHLESLEPDDFPNPTTAGEQPKSHFYELHNVVA